MVEFLTRNRGSEPHWHHCFASLIKDINLSLVLVQPWKTRPFRTERLLMGLKESNTKTPNGDRERRIFLSHLNTNNGFFFFLLTTKYRIFIEKKNNKQKQTNTKKASKNPVYTEIRHGDDILTRIDVRLSFFLSFPRAGTGM